MGLRTTARVGIIFCSAPIPLNHPMMWHESDRSEKEDMRYWVTIVISQKLMDERKFLFQSFLRPPCERERGKKEKVKIEI